MIDAVTQRVQGASNRFLKLADQHLMTGLGQVTLRHTGPTRRDKSL